MSSGGDGDRHCEHLGVSQTKQAKKKKSRRSIDPERILSNIILITVDQSVLHLLHMHCLHDATRTYLYRLFVEHDPYRQIWKEKVIGGTHKGRCYGLGSRNDVRRLQSGLEGIGSSRQAEALDGVQIAAMSDQIAKLIAALAESEWRRVAEQESMS
uniref:Uncharacterized protein n=1 Tax=Solanum tuberosum TaxID=4113 RepID=M1DT38_SOLTU